MMPRYLEVFFNPIQDQRVQIAVVALCLLSLAVVTPINGKDA